MLPRLAIVSYLHGDALSPRGIRTRELVNGLENDWQIEVISGPAKAGMPSNRSQSGSLHGAITAVSRSVWIDRHELWSKRRFSLWKPDADLGLLIGYPFSPIAEAARSLARHGIPYVVDAGDPWVLTSREPLRKHTALMRARRAERRMWERAAGAIVTTAAQGDALSDLFPHVPVMVRPNGYQEVPSARTGSTQLGRSRAADQPLRLVHFGRMYLPRVDIAPLLLRLAESKRWPSVVICQYGEDAEGVLDGLPAPIVVESRRPVPWENAVAAAGDFDLALAVGNENPNLLPSKIIEYLTLPIPRLAIVGAGKRNAIREYLQDKPGWLVISSEDVDPVGRIDAHASRGWRPEELSPPEPESWHCVAQRIGDFLQQCHRVALP
jgi:hypothetical protein